MLIVCVEGGFIVRVAMKLLFIQNIFFQVHLSNIGGVKSCG